MTSPKLLHQEIEWLTTKQAAEIMGITYQAVQRLCRINAVKCRKFGKVWQVSRTSAEAYKITVGGRGKRAGEDNVENE